MYLTANVRATGLHCVGVSLPLSRTEIIGDCLCKHPCYLKSNNVYVSCWLCLELELVAQLSYLVNPGVQIENMHRSYDETGVKPNTGFLL